MKSTWNFWLIAALILPVAVAGQVPDFILMDQEPHHHLTLQNDYVKVFNVEVAPGDSILMHRHDGDTVAIAVGEQMVTVGFPDKPEVHQKNPGGQLRLQKSGYIHSTRVDPGTSYHTVAVELLHSQSNPRNLCAAVMAGLPLNCPDMPKSNPSPKYIEEPQFNSDQTRVQIVRLLSGQKMTFGDAKHFQLIVALDPVSYGPGVGYGPSKKVNPGDYFWQEKGTTSLPFSSGSTEARFVEFDFNP
jgi:hypothetical protein